MPAFHQAVFKDPSKFRAILNVGNYGEIFEANVGTGTALNLQRGLNALALDGNGDGKGDGGLMYAMPLGSSCEAK